MRIKLLTGAVVKGHPGVQPGEAFDCNEAAARELLSMRIAEEVKDQGGIETREPVIENRDPGYTTENAPTKSRKLKSTSRA